MRMILLFAAVAAMLATAASADEKKPSKPDDQAAAVEAREADPSREICKITKTTGSRLNRQRICMTAAEWEKMRSENGRFLSERAKGSLPGDGG